MFLVALGALLWKALRKKNSLVLVTETMVIDANITFKVPQQMRS